MDVLIIPEDPTYDQYILKPVVERIFADLGKRAKVEVLRDPHLSGASQALDRATVTGIIEHNPMVDLFVLIVDRDCDREGNVAKAGTRASDHPEKLVACVAVEEVEVWMLYLLRDELHEHLESSFGDARAECDPKELFVEPLLDKLMWRTKVGSGRKHAMRRLGQHWSGLLRACHEIGELKKDIDSFVNARA